MSAGGDSAGAALLMSARSAARRVAQRASKDHCVDDLAGDAVLELVRCPPPEERTAGERGGWRRTVANRAASRACAAVPDAMPLDAVAPGAWSADLNEPVLEGLTTAERRRWLARMLPRLSLGERFVIVGLLCGYECSAIARDMRVSRQRVGKLGIRALQLLGGWAAEECDT